MSPQELMTALVGPFTAASIGLVLVCIGFLLHAVGGSALAKLLAIHQMPATPAARASQGAPVKLQGTIVPAERTLQAPLTGRTAVVWAVIAAIGSRNSELREVEKDRCDFWLDDGSGVHVRVRPAGATTMIMQDWLLDHLHLGGALGVNILGRVNDAQRAWAHARLGTTAALGYLEERVLQPGHPLVALGTVRNDNGVLVMQAASDALTLVAISPDEARARMARRRTVRNAFVAAGGLAVVAALAWAVAALAR